MKNNLIYAPRIFYRAVSLYSWLIFRKDFYVEFPNQEIINESTHFVLILRDKKTGQKYLIKHRNKLSDFYFLWQTKVKKLSPEEFTSLLKKVGQNPIVREIMPEFRLYKGKILWEFLENSIPFNLVRLDLSSDELVLLKERVDKAVIAMDEMGMTYGRIKQKHILIEKNNLSTRVVLIDWDNLRYK